MNIIEKISKLRKPKKTLNELFDEVKRCENEVVKAQNKVLCCKAGMNGLTMKDIKQYEKILDKKWAEYKKAVIDYNSYDNDPTNDYIIMMKRL